MNKNLMERFAVERDIHAKRFELLQHYMFLYGGRLKGERCRYEKFNDGEDIPSSKEGKACTEVLMEVQLCEEQMAVLQDRFHEILDKQRQN